MSSINLLIQSYIAAITMAYMPVRNLNPLKLFSTYWLATKFLIKCPAHPKNLNVFKPGAHLVYWNCLPRSMCVCMYACMYICMSFHTHVSKTSISQKQQATESLYQTYRQVNFHLRQVICTGIRVQCICKHVVKAFPKGCTGIKQLKKNSGLLGYQV